MTATEQSARCGAVSRVVGRPCDRPVVAMVSAGCVHEHVKTAPMCAHHLAELDAGDVFCAGCFNVGDPHECVVFGRVVDELAEAQP